MQSCLTRKQDFEQPILGEEVVNKSIQNLIRRLLMGLTQGP